IDIFIEGPSQRTLAKEDHLGQARDSAAGSQMRPVGNGGAEVNGRSSLKAPKSVRAAEEFSRTRLSQSFFMRDFLFSEIAASEVCPYSRNGRGCGSGGGCGLCKNLRAPLKAGLGRIAIRSASRSPGVNVLGCRPRLGGASKERNGARHTWDRRS